MQVTFKLPSFSYFLFVVVSCTLAWVGLRNVAAQGRAELEVLVAKFAFIFILSVVVQRTVVLLTGVRVFTA